MNTADKCKDITYSGGTTNLWRHFYKYHRALHDRLKALESPVCKQINLNNYIHSSSKQCHCIQNNHDHKDYERKLALYIIGNNCALSTIDSERFRAILPKSYQPPTRKTFYTNAILPLASEVDVILKNNHTYLYWIGNCRMPARDHSEDRTWPCNHLGLPNSYWLYKYVRHQRSDHITNTGEYMKEKTLDHCTLG